MMAEPLLRGEASDKAPTCSEYSSMHKMTTTPLIARAQMAGTPMAYMEVVVAWMTSAPMMLASREKRPPPSRCRR